MPKQPQFIIATSSFFIFSIVFSISYLRSILNSSMVKVELFPPILGALVAIIHLFLIIIQMISHRLEQRDC